jgi:hypothetical protein
MSTYIILITRCGQKLHFTHLPNNFNARAYTSFFLVDVASATNLTAYNLETKFQKTNKK